jgi:hypothetical protein
MTKPRMTRYRHDAEESPGGLGDALARAWDADRRQAIQARAIEACAEEGDGPAGAFFTGSTRAGG